MVFFKERCRVFKLCSLNLAFWHVIGRKALLQKAYLKFYFSNVHFYKRDTVVFLLVPEQSWDKILYTVIQLQHGKTLHQDVEIKIEMNGQAPHKDFDLFGGGRGLKIHLRHHQCLQTYTFLGLIRYVIRVSEPDLLRVSFHEYDGINWPIGISDETVQIFDGDLTEAISNNNFTTYVLKYNAPSPEPTRPPPPIPPARVTEVPPTFPPTRPPEVEPTIPPAPVTDVQPSFPSTSTSSRTSTDDHSIQSSSSKKIPPSVGTSKSHKRPPATTPSNNGTLEKSESAALIPDFDDCDDDLFLWLLIIVICIDVILAIILILLIILAHRGSKKMKAVMTNKKMKDPKAAATSAKQGAADATATSPMATTLSKKEAKGKKMKPAEKEAKGKTTGGGKKSTDGKTTTFYTVDQTKYYTIDNTFDKSKKGKK